MTEYTLTLARLAIILAKREGKMPTCEFQGCGKPLGDFVDEKICSNTSRGRQRYYCPAHRVEDRRI